MNIVHMITMRASLYCTRVDVGPRTDDAIHYFARLENDLCRIVFETNRILLLRVGVRDYTYCTGQTSVYIDVKHI